MVPSGESNMKTNIKKYQYAAIYMILGYNYLAVNCGLIGVTGFYGVASACCFSLAYLYSKA